MHTKKPQRHTNGNEEKQKQDEGWEKLECIRYGFVDERKKTDMRRFEYQITLHSSELFTNVVYFCSEEGSCQLEEVPSDQIGRLEGILNEQGERGWELAQASFGKQGLLLFWKKGLTD
jgi:hypothetical protein